MLPSVKIHRNALAQLLCASVEPFKKECLGILFGSLPTKTNNQFVITYVQPLQCVNRKRFTRVEVPDKRWSRFKKFFSKIPGRSRYIGDFHSHAEWGENSEPLAEMSKQDIDSMQKDGYALEILISISSCKGRPNLWAVQDDGSLSGSYGNEDYMYDFVISAYVLEPNYTQKPTPKKIKIIAPEFIKAFNYALDHRS